MLIAFVGCIVCLSLGVLMIGIACLKEAFTPPHRRL
jgi:hypothetical protein